MIVPVYLVSQKLPLIIFVISIFTGNFEATIFTAVPSTLILVMCSFVYVA